MAANNLLSTQAITELSLAVFQDSIPFLMTGNRQFEGEFTRDTYKRGQSVNIRKQNHYRADKGQVASIQATDEEFETLTLEQYNVAIDFNTKDLTLTIGQFKERYIDRMAQELKFKIEQDIATQAKNQLNHTVGTAGAPINTYQAVADVTAKMQSLMMPTYDAYMALNPNDTAALKGSLQNSFNDMLNKDISERGSLGRLDQFDMFVAQALSRQISGTPGAGPILIDGAVTSGATVVMDGFTALTLVATEGDIFTVAGVNSVSTIGRVDTGDLMTFVVTADVTSDGGGVATIPFAPTLISDPTNPRQNVTAPLANNAVVTFFEDHRVNVGYTRDSLDIVSPPLTKIHGSDSYVAIDKEAKCSLRIGRQGDIKNDINVFRVDVLIGFKWHPQYAIRFIS